MFLKSKTRELYTQDRFNLLHEENEGFSKLISIIIDPNNLAMHKLEQITNEIIQIIGFFNLEPNRVLDILLDAFENNPECHVLLSLIGSLFSNQHLKHVIGFKLSSYHTKTTPTTLLVMIVKLMQNKLLLFQDVIYYLGPHSFDDLEHLHDDYERELKKSREYTITLDNGSTESIEPRFEKSCPDFQKDQKFGLLIQLLNFDMVVESIHMLDILSKFDPHWSYDISIACCKSIEKITTPLYKKYLSSTTTGTQFTNDDKNIIENTLFPLIYHTKHEMYREIKSLTRIIRLLKLYIKQSNSRHQILVPVLACIFSSLCFVGMNTAIVAEFWNVLVQLPYQIRYEIYGFTRQHGYEKQPKMMAQQYYASRGIRHIFNRISFANVKTKAREILPYTVSNPIVVCEEFIRKCETYDNQIPLCIDVSQFSPELSHDIMQYCLINRFLSNQSSNIKEDGISIATWLSNLASLYGLFFKTYPFVDMKPVLNYLIQRLKEGLWEHLIILTEIIKYTSTLEYSEEINQQQLEAQAGGKFLHGLAGTFSPNSRNTGLESMKKLKDTILSSGSGISLVLLLSKLSNYGIHIHEDYQEWKHVADSKDMCHVAYLLLLKFLISEVKFVFEEEALSNELTTALLIPSIDVLKAYDLSTSFIFSIVRPTRSSIPPNILQSLLTVDINNIVTTQFYNFFWMKDVSDIYVPTSLYHNIMNEYGSHRSSLTKERDEQTQKYETTMKEFKEMCHKFFTSESEFVDMPIILQHCFLPRALFSAVDSLYCAKLVHLLHTSETPKFSFNLFLQYLLECTPGLVLACTENEAKRLSRLVQFLLSTSNRWYENSNEFNRECRNKPGSFISSIKFPQLLTSTSTTDDDEVFIKLDFDNYQKFHFLIMEDLLNNFILLLKSNDHIKIRMAMLFLSPLVKTNTFPFYSRHCDALLELSDSLKEHRVENIKVLSNTYFPLIATIRKKSENPGFIKTLLKFSVKPTNINIPPRESAPTAINSITTPNTAISESEPTSLTPQKEDGGEFKIGEFSDSGTSTSISPPSFVPTTTTPAVNSEGGGTATVETVTSVETISQNNETTTALVEAEENDIQMTDSTTTTTIQPQTTPNCTDETQVEVSTESSSKMEEDVVFVTTTESKTTTPSLLEIPEEECSNKVHNLVTPTKEAEMATSSEVINVCGQPPPPPQLPEHVPTIIEQQQQQLENESQVKENDTLPLDNSTQSNESMMNSKLVQLLKQKQQTKPEDMKSEQETKDYVKDIQLLLILPTNNPLHTIKKDSQSTIKSGGENTTPPSSSTFDKKASDSNSSSRETRSLQSSRRIDDNASKRSQHEVHSSSQDRRLSSNASSSSSSSKEPSSQKRESDTTATTKVSKSNEADLTKSDQRSASYDNRSSRTDSRETPNRSDNTSQNSQKNDNSRLSRSSEGRNLEITRNDSRNNDNNRNDNSRNDRNNDNNRSNDNNRNDSSRNFDQNRDSRYNDRYNDRRSSSQQQGSSSNIRNSSDNRDGRSSDFRKNDSSSNNRASENKGTNESRRSDSYQSEKRNSSNTTSSSSDNNNNNRRSSSGDLKRPYSSSGGESTSSNNSNNRHSEHHESETKKKRFHR